MPQYTGQRSSGYFKYLITNQVESGDDSGLADTLSETVPTAARLIPIREGGWRGISILPFGVGTADQDFMLIVQCVYKLRTGNLPLSLHRADWSSTTTPDNQWLRLAPYTMDCNLSTSAGSAGAFLIDTDKMCDAIVVTTNAYGTSLETTYGVADYVHAPSANTPASIWFMPDLGSPDYVYLGIDIDGGDGTKCTSANCLVKLEV